MPEQTRKYYYRIKDVPLVPLTDKVGRGSSRATMFC